MKNKLKIRIYGPRLLDTIHNIQTYFSCRNIYALAKDRITVGKYIKRMRLIDKSEELLSMTFSKFNYFANFMKKYAPEAADSQIAHEKLHYEHSIKNGLTDAHVGVYISKRNKEIFVNGVTINYRGNNFSGWTREQILKFEKENATLGAEDEWGSDSDIKIADFFRKIGL